MVVLDQSIDGSLSDAALRNYLHSPHPSAAEKREIRQFLYACEHGPSSVRTEWNGSGELLVRFTREHEYRRTLERSVSDVIVDERERIRFHDVELFAVTLEDQYPWAEEVIVGYYEGNVDQGVTSRAAFDWFDDNGGFLKTYEVPRAATGSVPSGFTLGFRGFGGSSEPWAEDSVVLAWER